MTTLHPRTTPPDAPAPALAGPADARDDSPAKEPEKDAKEPARLSLTQIVASGLAAVSTTVLLSVFGVAGTIIGAGLASVLTVVANFLYTRSIEKTHAQLRPVVGTIQARTATARLAQQGSRNRAGGSSAPVTVPLVPLADDAGAPAASTDEAAAPPPRNAWLRLVEKHGRARVLTASALAVFLVVMGVVLVVELALGKPLSDAVRGQEGAGTSISQLRDATPTGAASTDQDGAQDRAGQGDGAAERTAPGGTDGDQEPASGDGTATTEGDAGTTTEQGGTATSDPTGSATQEPTTDPTTDPTDPATGGTDSGETGTDGTGSGEVTDGGTDAGTDTGTGTDTGDDTSTDDGQVGSGDGTSDGTAGDTAPSDGSTPTPETTSGSTTSG